MVLTCFRCLFILATEGVCGGKRRFAQKRFVPEGREASE